jgi:hypothetical protein
MSAMDLETRWCMRHLAANFYSKFKNKDWLKPFKRMCMQNTESKMNEEYLLYIDLD